MEIQSSIQSGLMNMFLNGKKDGAFKRVNKK
jgi:hypothetical protein